jgi:hypothetical protein
LIGVTRVSNIPTRAYVPARGMRKKCRSRWPNATRDGAAARGLAAPLLLASQEDDLARVAEELGAARAERKAARTGARCQRSPASHSATCMRVMKYSVSPKQLVGIPGCCS